jgi:hypothetical protein
LRHLFEAIKTNVIPLKGRINTQAEYKEQESLERSHKEQEDKEKKGSKVKKCPKEEKTSDKRRKESERKLTTIFFSWRNNFPIRRE